MELQDFKVEVCSVDEILPHPNADRLQLAKVKGWQVVIPLNKFKPGDKVVYIPVDSVLPPELEVKLFPADSKIKLHNSRVKAIKIRQFVSQGMVESLDTFGFGNGYLVGRDVTKDLGIVKYEPPVPAFQMSSQQGGPASKKKQNPHFQVYTKFPRIQNYPNMFAEDEDVVITEKIHGTNFRAGWVPFVANNWWRKLLKLVRLAPKWQFVYGSHYVQLSEKFLYEGFYDKNVYAEQVKKYSLEERIHKGQVIYGEIYGGGIQKGYDYGLKDTRDLIIFDIQQDGKYLDYEDFKQEADAMYIKTCPVLYKGKFKDAPVEQLMQGKSVLAPEQKVREGCVIKPLVEGGLLPRKGAKVINPEYLLGDNTDFH